MEHKPIYNVRPINDLKDMLEQSNKLFGSKNAFWVKTDGENYTGITYSQFKNDVDAFGTAMIDLGLKDGYIAVISENRYEWCVTYMATVNGTGVIVPLDKELPPSEIENLLARSNASAIVFSGKFEKEIRKISQTLNTVKYYINMDIDSTQGDFLSFRELVGKGKKLILSGNRTFLDSHINPDIMNILLFTSGTTDFAKGVMLSHKNLCTDIMAVCAALYIDSNDSVLSILPLHHTYECTCDFLVMIYNGCTISFNEGLKHISKNLKETKPTILMLVPLILESMYKKIWEQASKKKGMKLKLKVAMHISSFLYDFMRIDVRKKLFKQIHENLGGKVRLVISGAAAINPEVSRGLRTFGLMVRQGYGLTECSPIVSVNRENIFRDDATGQPLPGVEVKIENIDMEGIGEIVVKGNNVMLGYFDNELATQKVLKNGWFYTGDLGQMDSSGFIFITGRQKNVIVTKNGKNIFPEEVETYLNKSIYVKESLIWGKPDETTGETIVNAQIVPDNDAIKEKLGVSNLTDEDIMKVLSAEVKYTNRSMPLYKRIKAFTVHEEEFAKTSSKKIKRYIEKTG